MSSVAGRTDIGPIADENQDAYLAVDTTDGGRLLVVCDGMGGMGRGAEAARLAVERLETLLVGGGAQSTLRAALIETDRHLRKTLVDGHSDKPGCTAVAVLVRDDRATVGWAGDARAMHIRHGRVVGHTVDHKLVEELIATGHLNRDRANKSKMSHVVTRCLGGRPSTAEAPEPEVLHRAWALQPGDAVVLCSDGLTDVVDEGEIAVLVSEQTADGASETLVRAALDAHTRDNVTVLVYLHKASTAGRPVEETPTVPNTEARGRAAPPHPDVPTARPDPLIQVAETAPTVHDPFTGGPVEPPEIPSGRRPGLTPRSTLAMGILILGLGIGVGAVVAVVVAYLVLA